MTANQYQAEAHKFASYGDDRHYPVLGLVEEAGEVAGKFAKAIRDEKGEITQERRLAIEKELGDVLWMVAEIGTNLNLPLEAMMEHNIQKLTDRKMRNKIHGEGDNR